MNPASLAAAVVLLFSVQGAHAETIYKSVTDHGEVVYSSAPVPGARESVPIEVDSLSPEQRRAALELRREDKALAAEIRAQESEWRRVDREILAAQKALAQAERSLRNGRTPLPGERRGNVGGGSRLTGAYFERLRELERAVDKAKVRLDRAYAARNALK
ncbi:MAG TPA: DUF4124 domain-containing protein [Burkholderiales bacterium]|nr:DUF4124 domain-containing protein [Burkholderiales bacterium]